VCVVDSFADPRFNSEKFFLEIPFKDLFRGADEQGVASINHAFHHHYLYACVNHVTLTFSRVV
jgi:hypothetical protein